MQISKAVQQRKDLRGKYRNPNGTYTAAALRARRPFAARNALLGVSLMGFCGFCYWWAYNSFLPDDFSDVPIPPVSEEELNRIRAERAKK